MLKDDFYSIVELNIHSASVDLIVRLNEKHSIYQGHFPGQPIVPGVCFMQMVKEIAEIIVNNKLHISRAEELKFLRPVHPSDDNILMGYVAYVIHTDDQIHVIANFSQNNNKCFKCKITFIRQ